MAAGSNFLRIITTDEVKRLRRSPRDGRRNPVAALAHTAQALGHVATWPVQYLRAAPAGSQPRTARQD
jgi:hypothetical protein